MRMFHYLDEKTSTTNFGDELNVMLWPKLLPGLFDHDDGQLFLGIGSILFDFFPPHLQKIVFGAGYGGYTPKPILDERWKFYFVRGRLTAQQLGIDPLLAVGDAAILLRSLELKAPAKRYKAAFMPHWQSMPRGHWPDICARAGVHLIDPRLPVEQVLQQLMACELVITEAMHGAIVADALRVPWIAVRPLRLAHRMKWFDWASALDLQLDFVPLTGPNAMEWTQSHLQTERWRNRLDRRAAWLNRMREPFAALTASQLAKATGRPPQLSTDRAICTAHSRMLEKLEEFKRDFAMA